MMRLCMLFTVLMVASARADGTLPVIRDEEYIRQLLLNAADEALRDRINSLFEVWMRDPTDQPRRALLGAHQAVNAYRDIIKALESKDWKIIAPSEPQAKLFQPPIPQPTAFMPIPEREGRRHHQRR